LKEDNEFTYFTAETTGFSSFVITGKINASSENAAGSVSDPETRSVNLKGESTGLAAEQISGQGNSAGVQGSGMLSEIASLLGEWIKSLQSLTKG
jgi:hypothetical protein